MKADENDILVCASEFIPGEVWCAVLTGGSSHPLGDGAPAKPRRATTPIHPPTPPPKQQKYKRRQGRGNSTLKFEIKLYDRGKRLPRFKVT